MKISIKPFLYLFLFGISGCAETNANQATIPKDTLVARQQKEVMILNGISSMYSKELILSAIFSLEGNSLEKFVPTIKKITIVKLNSLVENNKDTLDYFLKEYSKYLKKIDSKMSNQKIEKINTWCSLNLYFKALDNLDLGRPVFFKQIVFEMPKTRKIFDKYADASIGQDWDSLDVNQSILLSFDFLKYLTESSPDDRLEIISEFISRINKLKKN